VAKKRKRTNMATSKCANTDSELVQCKTDMIQKSVFSRIPGVNKNLKLKKFTKDCLPVLIYKF
jgi:hypothetical protein